MKERPFWSSLWCRPWGIKVGDKFITDLSRVTGGLGGVENPDLKKTSSGSTCSFLFVQTNGCYPLLCEIGRG